MANGQVVAMPAEFLVKIGVFTGCRRSAVGDTALIVGGAVLPNVLITSAEVAVAIGR